MKLMLLDDVSLSDGLLGHLNVLSLSSPPPPFLSLQLGFDLDREVYPLVVHAVVDEGDGNGRSLSSFALRAALPFCGSQTGQSLWPREQHAPSVGIRQPVSMPLALLRLMRTALGEGTGPFS